MWSKLSFIAFFVSLLSLVSLSTGINPLYLSYDILFYLGVVIFGLLGFIFSILANFFDRNRRRQNPVQSFIFYLGMIFVFAGIIFRFMHWPFTIYLFGTGILVSLVSMFIPFNREPSSGDDLLDLDE
ncbi:MAG: hypothetical protein R3277_11220 [Brumimicrobium sp.]|nr:hypothetical protein [Brumimicrobium sp.]